ncbi:ABC transporter permease [Aquisalibacillus elongatus]|uniref:ABC-type nitrate/sulfonate/bicarbonate transport system permease component n=1 Tax=Aquisalibacillus elongatus TaxID=485577 RepID=A0A3N5AZW7_9BACI|nr:ABC transporter permease [Aquisalibacillus elongatus]RPF50624.1 ABC-type nitrate/sulfonate/bicarbonate transport system permease component [Aquisalibacillus elongatus]
MKQLFQRGWRPGLVLILLFTVWELSVQLFEVQTWLLPAPSQIFSVMVSDWSDYSTDLFSTLQLILIGFGIGSSVGVLVGVALHLVGFLRLSMHPLLILTQNIPIIVLAPLLVVWFGFGMLPKLIVITLVCFFPITISLLDGLRQADRELMHYMKMAGANKKQIFTKLEWPNALPYLFSGLKISGTYSVMGAVISEWLGGSKGIGVYMTLAQSSFRTDRVFVAILITVFLSLLFFLIISWVERIVVHWSSDLEGESRGTS